jgi:hypothetical protein
MNRSETPRFDLWGQEMSGARPRTRRPARRRVRISGLRMAVFGLIVAACTALSVHLIDGTASADTRSISPRTIANAVNLRASDLPGFHSTAGSDVGVGGDPAAQFKRCFGSSRLFSAGAQTTSSRSFTADSATSSVEVTSTVTPTTRSVAGRDTRLITDPRLPRCLAAAFAAVSFTSHGVALTASDPQAMSLPAPVVQGEGASSPLSTRLSVVWTSNGLSFTLFVDVYAITVGDDEIGITAATVGQPYPLPSEQRLAAVMVSRALALPH